MRLCALGKEARHDVHCEEKKDDMNTGDRKEGRKEDMP